MSPTTNHTWLMIRPAMLSAVVAVAVSWLERAGLIAGVVLMAASLLPLVGLAVFFWRMWGWLDSLDELQRRIHVEAMFLQFTVTGLLVMGYGMLAKVQAVPNLPFSKAYPLVWLAMFVSWAVGIVWVRRRYR